MVGVALVSKGPKTNRTASSETPCSRSRDRGAPLRNAPRSQVASSQNRPHSSTSSGAGCGRGMPGAGRGARGLPSAPAQEAASPRGPDALTALPRAGSLNYEAQRLAHGKRTQHIGLSSRRPDCRRWHPQGPFPRAPAPTAGTRPGCPGWPGSADARGGGQRSGCCGVGLGSGTLPPSPGAPPPRQGPQHRAAGLGVPLVADVGSQSPAWIKPRNGGQRTLSAAPSQRSGRAACGPHSPRRRGCKQPGGSAVRTGARGSGYSVRAAGSGVARLHSRTSTAPGSQHVVNTPQKQTFPSSFARPPRKLRIFTGCKASGIQPARCQNSQRGTRNSYCN